MASFDFTNDNPLFALYACHAAILVLKMFLVTFLTGRQRFSKKVREAIEKYNGQLGAYVVFISKFYDPLSIFSKDN